MKSCEIRLFISAEVCNAMGNNVYSCCTSSNQCDENQGDCDSDDECIGNLQCGKDNCQSPFPTDADCCFSKFTMLYSVLHCKKFITAASVSLCVLFDLQAIKKKKHSFLSSYKKYIRFRE